ncbi:MAG: 3'-5' exonuclease [Saccharospirillum sp.]|uniref:3'-5' exonuclease n=1 Tax=Saccharospirillum sp. TaxID=2033801 RepID=UPI0032975650
MVNWIKHLFRPGEAWESRRYWVLDLELSGLDPVDSHILSAGWVCIEDGAIQLDQAGYCLFKKSALMGDDVSDSAHVHHITDQQREQGVDLRLWLQQQLAQHHHDIWVMHHSPLDLRFLKMHSQRLGVHWPKAETLDTMLYEKRRIPPDRLGTHATLNLNACRHRYSLPHYRSHHAFSDALATAELFLAQVKSRRDTNLTDRKLKRLF